MSQVVRYAFIGHKGESGATFELTDRGETRSCQLAPTHCHGPIGYPNLKESVTDNPCWKLSTSPKWLLQQGYNSIRWEFNGAYKH